MSIADIKYKNLIKDIYKNGSWDRDKEVRAKYADGTPAYCKSVFGRQVIFEEDELPLLTCKKVFTLTAIKEMYLFWIKQTVKKEDFEALSCKIWDEWFLPDGTLGKSYAYQFTSTDGRNQVVELINNIKNNPTSKRLMTSFWNYNDVNDKALQECAFQTQWHVRGDRLDLILTQRSCDTGLGLPFNWFQYKVLQMLIAHCTGYKPGRFIHHIGNLHYYDRHESTLLNQLSLEEFNQPEVELQIEHKDFFNISYEDVKVKNYICGPYLSMEVAI